MSYIIDEIKCKIGIKTTNKKSRLHSPKGKTIHIYLKHMSRSTEGFTGLTRFPLMKRDIAEFKQMRLY